MGYIPKEVEVRNKYDAYKSLHRGAITYSINVGMSRDTITRKNRGRDVEDTKNKHASFSKMKHYTQVKQAVAEFL